MTSVKKKNAMLAQYLPRTAAPAVMSAMRNGRNMNMVDFSYRIETAHCIHLSLKWAGPDGEDTLGL